VLPVAVEVYDQLAGSALRDQLVDPAVGGGDRRTVDRVMSMVASDRPPDPGLGQQLMLPVGWAGWWRRPADVEGVKLLEATL